MSDKERDSERSDVGETEDSTTDDFEAHRHIDRDAERDAERDDSGLPNRNDPGRNID